ncbi:type II toxin-antitoxin system VapC family toxin [bacterium]|nr:type II toxin-antitoxin system VapC family toxin [Candidatus Neomarinimicrobiota bacterium]MCK5684817.1 type II toxin-antitoxin system VapC family toxin [bacterium]
MKYFIDSNIIIYFLKGQYPSLTTYFIQTHIEDIYIPAIVKAELLFGIQKSKLKRENREKYLQFLAPFEIIPFDNKAALSYSLIRSELECKGNPIGPNDLMIAAIVHSRSGTLVTHNTKEFAKVPGLFVADWTLN